MFINIVFIFSIVILIANFVDHFIKIISSKYVKITGWYSLKLNDNTKQYDKIYTHFEYSWVQQSQKTPSMKVDKQSKWVKEYAYLMYNFAWFLPENYTFLDFGSPVYTVPKKDFLIKLHMLKLYLKGIE